MTEATQEQIDSLEGAVAYLDWVRNFDDLTPVKQNAALAILSPVADYLADHLADILHTTEPPSVYAMAMCEALNLPQPHPLHAVFENLRRNGLGDSLVISDEMLADSKQQMAEERRWDGGNDAA